MAEAAKTNRRRRRTEHFVATNPEDDRAFQESLRLALAMSAAEAAGAPPPPPPAPPPPARRSPPAPKSGRASSPTKKAPSRKGEAARAPKRRKKSGAAPESGALEENANLALEPTAYAGVESAPAARKFRATLPARGGGKGQVLGWYATSLEAAASHDEAARLKGRRTNFAARRPDGDELPLFGRPPEPKRPPRAPWYERLIAERVSSSSPRRPPKKPAPPPPAADASDDDDLAAAASCAACRGKHCRHTCGRQTRMDGAY